MDNKDYKWDVSLHQTHVFNWMQVVLDELEYRQATHDQSKLSPEEEAIYAKITPKLKTIPFGTEAYNEAVKELGPALKHHYAVNRHHPEHFFNGVSGMNLIDVMEMLIDWVSVSDVKETDIKNDMISYLFNKYDITEPLASILINTVDFLKKGDK